MAYKQNKINDHDEDDFQAQSDADTLMRHQEITSDPERHQRAADHLQKKMQDTKAAHSMARKQLLKKTRGRLDKTFGKGPANFGQEADAEKGQMEQTVNEKE